MKTLITLMLLVLGTMTLHAQTGIDKDGNFYQTSKSKTPPKSTNKTYTNSKGDKYPVFETATGKMFINMKSKKSGKEYRKYLEFDKPKN